ncbi:MAG: transposase [Alphaproteobacteria bacterium]
MLESIPGIGHKTSVAILSELPDIKNFKNAKEVTAFAGLGSKRKESGTSVRVRGSLCKRGSSALRKALFFPAIVAKQHNPILKEFSERLVNKGKNGMVIVSAIMRKLLHIIYGVLKNRQVFKTS